MAVSGADVAQLRATAAQFTTQAGTLESSAKVLHSLIGNGSYWRGPDADRFRAQWTGEAQRALTAAVEALRRAADELRRHAGEQEQASQGGGSASPADTVGLYQRIAADDDGVDDGIHIDRVIGPDGKTRLIVYFEGTLGADRLSELRNAGLIQGDPDSYLTDLIDEALRGLPDGKNTDVMLVGFSQGGMDAQNIAASGRYHVTNLVTYGSPIIQPDEPGIDTVHMRAEGDNVPGFGAAVKAMQAPPVLGIPGAIVDMVKDATGTSSAGIFQSGVPDGSGNGIYGNHSDKAYTAVATVFDESDDPRFADAKESMKKYQGTVLDD